MFLHDCVVVRNGGSGKLCVEACTCTCTCSIVAKLMCVALLTVVDAWSMAALLRQPFEYYYYIYDVFGVWQHGLTNLEEFC